LPRLNISDWCQQNRENSVYLIPMLRTSPMETSYSIACHAVFNIVQRARNLLSCMPGSDREVNKIEIEII
jgi:hypothetical protein